MHHHHLLPLLLLVLLDCCVVCFLNTDTNSTSVQSYACTHCELTSSRSNGRVLPHTQQTTSWWKRATVNCMKISTWLITSPAITHACMGTACSATICTTLEVTCITTCWACRRTMCMSRHQAISAKGKVACSYGLDHMYLFGQPPAEHVSKLRMSRHQAISFTTYKRQI